MFNKKHFDHRLDILELYLTVRDPGTSRAAEAYDGLRKLLINANRGTQVHLAHLAELHRVVSAADSLEPVRAKVGEFMHHVGLFPMNDATHRDLFEFTGGHGSVVVVDSPAYVSRTESGDMTVVMRGVAHYERDRESLSERSEEEAILDSSLEPPSRMIADESDAPESEQAS